MAHLLNLLAICVEWLLRLFNRLASLEIGDERGCTVFGRASMNRELALKIVLAVVGCSFWL